MGGKSGSGTAGYKYYAGFQMVLAKYIHKILRIRVDQKEAWVGSQVGPATISINKPDLFGAQNSSDPEGGIVGDINFQPGLSDQLPDDYLSAKIGTAIPASRGVSAIVGHQAYLGNNPYMKQWDVLAERIHLQDNGVDQWYTEKAGIVNSYKATPPQSWVDFGSPGYVIGQLYKPVTPITGVYDDFTAPMAAQYGVALIPNDVPDYIYAWRSNESGLMFSKNLDSPVSSSNVPMMQKLIDRGLGPNQTVLVQYYVTANIALSVYTLGAASSPPASPVGVSWREEGFSPMLTSLGSVRLWSIDFVRTLNSLVTAVQDMNPAHMLRECLLNKEWGFGYDEDDLDDDSFTAAAGLLYDELFGLSYFWDDDNTDIGDVIEKILDHIDGQLYVDRRTQLWTLLLVRGGYDQSALPVFTFGAEISSMDSFNRPAFMELINQVTVSYYNIALADTSTVVTPNPALFLQQGVRKDQDTTYEMCCSSGLASRLGQRDLNVLSNPLATGTVFLLPSDVTENLHRGSVCKLDYPKYSLNETVVRVTAITFGNGKTRLIKMSFVEDQFALPEEALTMAPPIGWVDHNSFPVPVAHQLAMEIPYAYLIKSQGQSQIDSMLADDSGLGFLGVAAVRPPGGFSATLYVDSGSGYGSSNTVDFGPFGLLAGDLEPLTDTLTLTGVQDLGELELNTVFQIGSEIMSFSAISGNVLTGVIRGLYDTVPTKHHTGDPVYFFENYLDSDEVDYETGESISARLLTKSAGGVLSISSAPTSTVAMVSRAISPYPPGQVKIGGAAYPSTVSGTFTVTWKHRNRQTQADTLVPTTSGDVTPRVNTRYTLRFLDGTNTLIIERTSIGPGTASVVLNYTGAVTMELFTVDSDGASIQRHSINFAYTPPGGTVVSAITATAYTPVDNTPIIDGGGA